jgi:MFS family permease
MCQSTTWNIYSPIYPAVYKAFPSWTSPYLNWLINSANVSFGLSLYPVSRAIPLYGPRKVTIVSSLMILLGASLRCIPIPDGETQQAVQVIAMLCNGCGGAWLNFGGPILSETWFPAEERTTATAIASVATYTGAALGFVVGPAVVGSPATREAAKAAIDRLFYSEAAVCLICALMAIFYFPDRPKYPPSEAASAKREAEERQSNPKTEASGMPKEIPVGITPYFAFNSKTLKYWVISLCMALPLGLFQGWSSTMFSCLKPLNVTQDEASWLGFLTTAIGCFCSVLVGAILDRFAGRLKLVTEVLMVVATLSFLLFGINVAGQLNVTHHTQIAIAYATAITGGAALNITVPLFFELIMESIYGWADENIGSMITILINTLMQIGFLIALAVVDPNASTIWTSWALAASMAVAFVFMFFLRIDYRRLAVDLGTDLKATGCHFDRAGFY